MFKRIGSVSLLVLAVFGLSSGCQNYGASMFLSLRILAMAASGKQAPATGRKDLPAEEYLQLRAKALASANVQLTPRFRNPKISKEGFEPVIAATLEEQRNYLQTHSRLARIGVRATQNSAKDLSSSPYRSATPDKKPDQHLLLQASVSGTASSRSLPCHAPIIRSVNGRGKGVTFTPQVPDNSYRIEGCLFGSQPGRVQLEPRPLILGQSSAPIVLQFDSPESTWSDSEIDVHLNSTLSALPDSPVTLVIYLANGQRVELPGCFFVAARGAPQLLNVIPSSWVKLHASGVRSRSVNKLEYVSPPAQGGDVPKDATGTSAFVLRSDSEQFGIGNDIYDFSRLRPGWVVESVQLQTYIASCPGVVTYTKSSGAWNVQWNAHSITVNLQDDICASTTPPFFGFNMSLSEYAPKVWVVGPVGTQPLAGNLP
jgi:hypothetical protein